MVTVSSVTVVTESVSVVIESVTDSNKSQPSSDSDSDSDSDSETDICDDGSDAVTADAVVVDGKDSN